MLAHRLTRTVEFDAGHRVPLHGGKCRNPHGHRYVVEATLAGELVDDLTSEHGMVVDFGTLKAALGSVVESWDHAFLVWREDRELLKALDGHGWAVVVLDDVPTAENLARLVFERLTLALADELVTVVDVTVWETPNCRASYGLSRVSEAVDS